MSDTKVNNPKNLEFLIDWREDLEPKFTQDKMARHFGLMKTHSKQTVGKWERGQEIPSESKHRATFFEYLKKKLRLGKEPPESAQPKIEKLLEEWKWASLTIPEKIVLGFPATERMPFQALSYSNHFVGRSRKIKEIQKHLQSATDQINIVAIVGMGGIGKTTLAAYIARLCQNDFPDGVLWARVATDDPLNILQSWALAYGYDFNTISDPNSRAAEVRNILAEKQILIILDDVAESEQGNILLPNSPNCAVLLTTRDQNVAGAINANHIVELDELKIQEGVELLISILDKDENRVRQEHESAQAICEILDHLPLAIEITAQRLRLQPTQKLAAMVELLEHHRLDFLQINDRAVRTSFDMSWKILKPEQQRIFALIDVFKGRRFTVKALAYVAELDDSEVVNYLQELIGLSLVSQDKERYVLHPLLADFAGEKLAQTRPTQDNNPDLRMTEFFFRFAEENQRNYGILKSEFDDIMFGMATAHDLEQWQSVLDYTTVLMAPWYTCGEYIREQQGYVWADDALKNVENKYIRAHYLCNLARSCFEQNQYEQSQKHLAKAQAIAEKIDEDMTLTAKIAYWQGQVALEYGEHGLVEEYLARSERCYFTLEDEVGIGLTKYQRGQLLYDQGQLDSAENYCREAIELQKENEQRLALIASFRLLADICIERGELTAAHEHSLEALQICETLHNQSEQAAVYYTLGVIAGEQRDIQSALGHIEDSLGLSERFELQDLIAINLYELSKLQALQNNFVAAIELAKRSTEMFKESGQLYSLVYVQKHLACLYYEIEKYDTAIDSLEEAIIIAQRIKHPLTEELSDMLERWCNEE